MSGQLGAGRPALVALGKQHDRPLPSESEARAGRWRLHALTWVAAEAAGGLRQGSDCAPHRDRGEAAPVVAPRRRSNSWNGSSLNGRMLTVSTITTAAEVVAAQFPRGPNATQAGDAAAEHRRMLERVGPPEVLAVLIRQAKRLPTLGCVGAGGVSARMGERTPPFSQTPLKSNESGDCALWIGN
jgi:hypothetical protein